MTWCEANRVDYVFGLARNQRLVERIADELAMARGQSLATDQSVRRFKEFFTVLVRTDLVARKEL